MGRDKAFLEIDGLPLWRRQIALLQDLAPAELMIAGPPHSEWAETGCVLVPDVRDDAGPLAGIVSSLRICSNPLLVTLAIDLPNITSDYLEQLIGRCSPSKGAVPAEGEQFEPVAAVYPKAALALAETCLAVGNWSLQEFARACVRENLVAMVSISDDEKSLFLNMNTPADLPAAAANHHVAG